MSLLSLDDLDQEQSTIYFRYRKKSGKVGEFEVTLQLLKEWFQSQMPDVELEVEDGVQEYDFEDEITDIQGDHQMLIKGEDWTQVDGVLTFILPNFPIATDTYVKLKTRK